MMDQVIPQPSQLPAEHTLHAAMSFSGRWKETVQGQVPIHIPRSKGHTFCGKLLTQCQYWTEEMVIMKSFLTAHRSQGRLGTTVPIHSNIQ